MTDQRARFELIEPKGKGQYADVWLARDLELGRLVAIKVFRHSAADFGAVRDHARALARINHPNVVVVHGVSTLAENQRETVNCSFVPQVLVMEYVEGISLGTRLAGEPLGESEVRSVATDLFAGLSAIHEAGIAHRDLHSENVLIGNDGRVRIIDLLSMGTALFHHSQLRRDQARDVRDLTHMIQEILLHSGLPTAVELRFRSTLANVRTLEAIQIALNEALQATVSTTVEVLTARRPDVRVKVKESLVLYDHGNSRPMLQVTVENHSPVMFYATGLSLRLSNGNQLIPLRDPVYQTRIGGCDVEPGNSWSTMLDPAEVFQVVETAADADTVVVVDKIGREYVAPSMDTRNALKALQEHVRQTPVPDPVEPKSDLAMVILDMVAEATFSSQSREVEGLKLRLRLRGSHRKAQVVAALDSCVPAWLHRSKRHGKDYYSLTRRGLERASIYPDIAAFVLSYLGYLEAGISRDLDDFLPTSEDMHHYPPLSDVEIPFAYRCIQFFNLSGGLSGGGTPINTFTATLPRAIEDLLDCKTMEDVWRTTVPAGV